VTGLGTLLAKELREQWRTRRLPVLAIVFLAFGILSPLLARYTPELLKLVGTGDVVIEVPPPTIADAVAQFVRNVGQVGVFAAILLTMGSVAGEKERGTAAMWLTKPVSRGAFLAAKAMAVGVSLAIGVTAASLGAAVYTALLFDAPPIGGWIAASVLMLLQILAYAAVTFLGSTLARSTVAAGAVGIAGLVVVAIAGALPVVGDWTPSGLATAALDLGVGDAPERPWQPVVATIVLIAGMLIVSWAAFRHQEL